MSDKQIRKLARAWGRSCRRRLFEMVKTVTKDKKLQKELMKVNPITVVIRQK